MLFVSINHPVTISFHATNLLNSDSKTVSCCGFDYQSVFNTDHVILGWGIANRSRNHAKKQKSIVGNVASTTTRPLRLSINASLLS